MTRLIPLCHVRIENPSHQYTKEPAYASTGHLLPCCWCDSHFKEEYEDMVARGMFDESLKIDNVNSLDDILNSPQWLKFHWSIREDQDNAPLVCKRKCKA